MARYERIRCAGGFLTHAYRAFNLLHNLMRFEQYVLCSFSCPQEFSLRRLWRPLTVFVAGGPLQAVKNLNANDNDVCGTFAKSWVVVKVS